MTEEEPFLSEWESGRVVGPLPASHGTRASLRVLGSGGQCPHPVVGGQSWRDKVTLHGHTAWHSRARTPAWLWAFRNQLEMVRQMG